MSPREHNIIGTCILVVILTFVLLGMSGCMVIQFDEPMEKDWYKAPCKTYDHEIPNHPCATYREGGL
jgi:hypothetical protein